MTETATAGATANAEQVTFWNDVGGPKWVRHQAMLDRQLEALGQMAMDAAAIEPGNAVLDIGCGCGSTTLAIARKVGPNGKATGIDISHPMLTLARERAAAEHLDNATFIEADAQTSRVEPAFDVVFSRFGVMFFDDSVRAFTNLHGGLGKQVGRLAFVCWQALPLNPWMVVPMMAALKHISIDPPAPEAPGPFAFADSARVERILSEAGFHEIRIAGKQIHMTIAGGMNLDETANLIMELGPLGRALADKPPQLRETIAKDVREAIASYETPEGVTMPGAVWLVTAKA